MSRQSSDFRAGVEAAAKWLREYDPDGLSLENFPDLATEMLATVGDDPEGTEARTVAQIVQYLRECAMVGNVHTVKTAIARVANDVEAGDWKRS